MLPNVCWYSMVVLGNANNQFAHNACCHMLLVLGHELATLHACRKQHAERLMRQCASALRASTLAPSPALLLTPPLTLAHSFAALLPAQLSSMAAGSVGAYAVWSFMTKDAKAKLPPSVQVRVWRPALGRSLTPANLTCQGSSIPCLHESADSC
jgi:hypothetical protein